MSGLRLFAPVESSDLDELEFPATIPFPSLRGDTTSIGMMFSLNSSGHVNRLVPVLRAKVLHTNRVCPYCRRATVEPIELNDGVLNRQRLPIPGTATLVGFHCQECDAEWPAR
ncbi:MAG: hypothetical protein ACKVT0_08720 [Planctomycetaceae bacterium]